MMIVPVVSVMVYSSSLSRSPFLLFSVSVSVSSYDDNDDDDPDNYNAEDDTYEVDFDPYDDSSKENNQLSHQECVYL